MTVTVSNTLESHIEEMRTALDSISIEKDQDVKNRKSFDFLVLYGDTILRNLMKLSTLQTENDSLNSVVSGQAENIGLLLTQLELSIGEIDSLYSEKGIG